MKFRILFCFLLFIATQNIQAQIITTIAGTGVSGYNEDGIMATNAELNYAFSIVMDTALNLYFSDYHNHRIRKINPAGIISTFAGIGNAGYSGDGGSATNAKINDPYGLAIDAAGNLYIGDQGNNRVRKVSTSGIISTVAGSGGIGYGGDGGDATAASLNSPDGVAVDKEGNLYIADVLNNRIRKVSADGTINTIAGTGGIGFSGDGSQATSAILSHPLGIVVDDNGIVYFTDNLNRRIRKINTDGVITTIAGSGIGGSTGDGGPATAATFEFPALITLDGIGNLYFTDGVENNVRKINTSGTITTIAGTGVAGFSGDGGPATAAELRSPFGIHVDALGDVYIGDLENYRVRKISNGNHLPGFVAGHETNLAACKNAVAVSVDTVLSVLDADPGQTETWALQSGPYHGTAIVTHTDVSSGGQVDPTGLFYTPLPGYTGNDTFIVRIDDGYSVSTVTVFAAVSDCGLGLENRPNKAAIVYPNPNTGSFSVLSPALITIAITNSIGFVIKTISIPANKSVVVQLDVPSGIYFLSGIIAGEEWRGKLSVIK